MFQLFITYAVISACLLVRYTVTQYKKDAKKYEANLGCNHYPLCSSLTSQFVTSLKIGRPLTLGPVCRQKSVLLYLCSLLLAQSYAPEPNPGPRPIKYPCVICEKAVRWNTPGVCCDSCDRWYHQRCMGMSEGVYCGLKNVSWECFHCGALNLSTSLFDTTIFETTNSFSFLNETSNTEASDMSFSNPIATSSPTKVAPGRSVLPLRV